MTGVKCERCGRFCVPVEWKMVYSGSPPTPDHEIFRCAACVMAHGHFVPSHGIKPEFSCGVLPL